MGWEIIALGSIEIKKLEPALSDGTILTNMHRITREIEKVDFVVKCVLHTEAIRDAWIELELSGNKSIDYTPLEQALVVANKNADLTVKCTLSEYSETGDGFYFGDEEVE